MVGSEMEDVGELRLSQGRTKKVLKEFHYEIVFCEAQVME